MKVSMHNWMRPEPIEHTIERLARLGYDGIEISGEPQLFDVGAVRGLLDEHGIDCWGAVTLMMGGRDLLARGPVRAPREHRVRQGLPDVRLRARRPDPDRRAVDRRQDRADGLARRGVGAGPSEALKRCQAHAESVGVRIGLEPLNRFETYFLNRCEQALALAEAVGGDCGVCLDAFHMNIEESDLLGAIRAAGDRLVDFHVADNNRMPPGYGALDWDAIVRELVGIGYDGHLTVEFVASVDRSAVSQPLDIGDASEAGGGVGDREVPARPRDGRRARGAVRALRVGLEPAARGVRGQRSTRGLMPAVALIGTLDTKGDEIAYVRERLTSLGVDVIVIDSGILGEPHCRGRHHPARGGARRGLHARRGPRRRLARRGRGADAGGRARARRAPVRRRARSRACCASAAPRAR